MNKPKIKPPDLTIVILSYNVSRLLENCLESIFKAKTNTDNWQVVVVDNASTDDSVAMVRKNFPRVRIIANKNNLGFSAGNNVALKQIKTEYCLLLNPDTEVFPQTIQTVLKYLVSHPEAGAATCRVELPDGSLDYSCHRRFPDPWNSFIYLFTGQGKHSSYAFTDIPKGIHEIDSLCGAFAMFRSEVGQKLGWFDEKFWWNGEDLDLCYRIKETGSKIFFIPDVRIIHFKGSSSGLQKTAAVPVAKAIKIRTAISGLTAMRIFYDKHYASKYPTPFNWFIYSGMWVLRTFRILKISLGLGL